MSTWNNYVESELLSNGISEGAIIGTDGAVWGKSKTFPATAAELKAFISKFEDLEALAESGIIMGGTKYFYLSSDHDVIRASKGTDSLHAMKLKKLYIIALYNNQECPTPKAANTVEKLGNYLAEYGH